MSKAFWFWHPIIVMVVIFLLFAGVMIGMAAERERWTNKGNKAVVAQEQSGFGGRPDQPRVFSTHRRNGTEDLGGVYEREGLKIDWAGSDQLDSRVRPKHVLSATIERLQAEQKTNLGSDANARAMVLLMQAQAILDGTEKTTEYGPVIE